MIKSFQHITTLESTQGRSITWSYTYLVISVLKTFNNIQDLNNHVDAFHIYLAQVCRQHAEPCSTCDVCGLTATPLSNLPDHLSRHDAHNDVTFEDSLPFPSSMAMIHFLWAEMITLWISCNPMCSNPYQIQLPWPLEILSLFPIQSKLSQPSKKTLWELQPPSHWY